MAGITGMGTTYNLPNYVGELFALTPDDTPLLSAIGGLTGGGETSATEFEWQSFDLRDPGQRVRLEGATAPTAEERVRANVRNVCQIHQEKVSVSYTKQSATGQIAGPQAAPFNALPGANPVGNELNWQVQQALKSIALDVNWSFINGTYQLPTDSSTAHGLVDGDKIVFTNTSTATGIVAGRAYFVDQQDVNSFKVSNSNGGAPITLGTATGIAFTKVWATTLTTDHVNDLLQLAFDNGGISEQETATLLVNSIQKRAITKAYMTAFSGYMEQSRNVGGVNVTTVTTDFGTLNVMMDRHMPQDSIAVVSLEDLMPVFLNVPGKGHFFEEPLAKTGASDEVQLYGEIGLKYGAEKHHALMTGLKLS